MKEVIKIVKSEIERLRPIVEEFHKLENLLAFLEGPNKDITNINNGTIKPRRKYGSIEIRIDASMPEDIRNKYNLNIGDTFNSSIELSRLIHVDKNIVYKWVDKGYIKSDKKRVYIHNSPVKITDIMTQKLLNKYGVTTGDFWHSVDDMRNKLGISLSTVTQWSKQKYIEFFEL